MKKQFALVLSVLLLLSLLAGCGKTASPEEETTAAILETAMETTAAVPETEAPAETEAPTEPVDPRLGKWIGVYADVDGFMVPMGREEGMAINIILNQDGAAVYELFLEDEDDLLVNAVWSGEENAFEIESDSEEVPGTFVGNFEDGVLIIQDLPIEGCVFKLAKEGTQQITDLQSECQMFKDILDAVNAETTEP